MMLLMRVLVLPLAMVMVLLSFSVDAQAERFEIFPTGMTSSCSEEFENIANSLQPGDELVLNDGVYAQGCARRLFINGTAAQPIIIRAADGASPLITRPPETSAVANNMEISGSYFTIRGLRFQYGSSGVRFMSSNNIVFEDNEIFDTLNNALTMNSGNTDSHIVRNNHIHHTGLASGSTEGEGMYIGDHNGSGIATNHLIENNHIHDLRGTSSGGNDGIEIKFGSGGNIVRGNLIHDTNIGQQYPCIFVYGHGAAPNIIENNLVFNCGEAILVTADAIIRNNIILDSSISGIHLNRQNPAPNVQNVTIVNNTVYGSHPVCADLNVGTAPGIVIANNAFFCAGSTAISGGGISNATVLNNYVAGSVFGASIDNVAFFDGGSASAAFTAPGAADFHLPTGSVLIDAGDSTISGIGSTDYDGNARVAGTSIDVGAFESGSGGAADPPTLTFTGPTSVDSGATATLSWVTTNADSCSASGGWSGIRAASGSETVGPLLGDTLFALTCTGSGGSVTDSVTIAVTAPPPKPTASLSGPASVASGATATLSWTSTDATSCEASGEWSGNRPLSGTGTVGPLFDDSVFTLTCTGSGGSATDTITIAVSAAPPVPTVNLDGPASVDSGATATLSWTSTNASSCAASGDWSGSTATNGAQTVGPLTKDSTFTLTCTGPGGSAQDTVAVAVTAPPPPPTLSFTGPATIDAGATATLTWMSTNASTCEASGDWTGSRALSGTQQTAPLNADSSFVLTCTGAGGAISATVSVQVQTASDDSDSDGLLDDWEQLHFGTLSETGAGDPDNDGASNAQEQTLLSDPLDADTDNDGLTDGEEIGFATDLLNADTDGDGFSDGTEVQTGSDPLDSASQPLIVAPPAPANSGGSGATDVWTLLVLLLAARTTGWRRKRM